MTKAITAEQFSAIRDWQQLNGRNWKSALRQAWMTGIYDGFERSNVLQTLRNMLGPSWLVSFRLSQPNIATCDACGADLIGNETRGTRCNACLDKASASVQPSLEVKLIGTEELQRVASHLRAHDELFSLDVHERADLNAILAELDARGVL